MKTVKSLLLGAAAGFVGLTGAQAADLPGKAAPAEYVRICDTYGAGFFFIPGTDTCLRIGGFARVDYVVNNLPPRQLAPGAPIGTSLFDDNYETTVRLTLFTDARSNTEYGLLRAFGQFSAYRGPYSGAFSSQGVSTSGVGQAPRSSAINLERAFIQFAGFTFGFSASFFNFYQGDLQFSNNFAATARSTTTLAYTATFGSGFSATIAVEDSMYRRYTTGDVWSTTTGGAAPGSGTGNVAFVRPFSGIGGLTYAGQQVPDIVGNLRVDQGWGSVQVMAAAHQLVDYGFNATGAPTGVGGVGTSPNAAAGNKWGWAVGAGLRLNLDTLARGDQLWLQYVYADGALDYAFGTAPQGGDRQTISGAANLSSVNGMNAQLRDAVVTNVAGTAGPSAGDAVIRTVKAWSVAAGFRHFWTPALRSSIFGSYSNIDGPAASTLWDIKYWNVGVNTIWSPVRNLDLGVEVVYTNLSARNNGLASAAAGGPGGCPVISTAAPRCSEGIWVGTFRVQRNF